MKGFYIIIIDSGWPTEAHKVLKESMDVLKGYLEKDNQMYIFTEKESQEFLRDRADHIGVDPIIIITKVDPVKIIHQSRETIKEELNGIALNLGGLHKAEVLKFLIEICRLIRNQRFVSEISWEERKQLVDSLLLGVVENFFVNIFTFLA